MPSHNNNPFESMLVYNPLWFFQTKIFIFYNENAIHYGCLKKRVLKTRFRNTCNFETGQHMKHINFTVPTVGNCTKF